MNIVICAKKLAVPLFASLLLPSFAIHAMEPTSAPLPSKYTYTANTLDVHFKNSTGQRTSLNVQQCSKLEAPANATNSNYLEVNYAGSDAFGIHLLQALVTCDVTINTANTSGFQMAVNLADASYSLFQDRVQIATNDQLSFSSGSGGMGPYTLTDGLELGQTGLNIPKGPHYAGETFSVSSPVSVTTDAGSTETDTFHGKVVLGEVQPLRGDDGEVIGTRFIAMHLCGKVIASDGGTYEIDQNIGQTDVQGIMPGQLQLDFTLTDLGGVPGTLHRAPQASR
jgi:hypothetical protein